MCIDVFCRKVKIVVKGPKEYKLLIVKSSIPGRYAKNPRVFWGGDNKIMRASFSDSASLMPYAIIATVHDGNGQVLKTFNLPNSFLAYKRFVFHLEEPYQCHGILCTGWLEDLLRFFVRRNKSQEPDNIPTVFYAQPKSSTPPFPDLVPVAPYYEPSLPLDGIRDKVAQWNDNGSHSCEMNGGHLLLNTDVSHQPSSQIEISSPQMSPNSVSDTAVLPNSLSQQTDESCERGSSSNHTPYYDAYTSPFSDSYSPNSSHVPLDRSARNMGSRSLSTILGNTWKELKGIMDLQAG